MKEYAKGFYKSAAWKRARQQVITRSNGLCERCKARGIYKPGYIVHHKEYITPGNISNPNITLTTWNMFVRIATTKNTRQYIHQCVISMMQTEIYYRRKKIINQTTPPGYRI